MPRRFPGLCISRHFVLRVAMSGQQLLSGFLNVPENVVFGQHRWLIPEHRVGLQGQLIPGQVGRREGNGLAQIGQCFVLGLIRQAVHQVQVEVVETGPARHVGGANRFVAVVNAAQRLEFGFLKALNADRQPIDAQAAIGAELGLFEGAGVGFQGDLDVAGKADALFDALQQAPQRIGAEQARRTATKEDRLQLAAVDVRQVKVEVGEQGVDIFLFRQHRAGGVRVEVAVRAFAHAPRNMDV